MSATCGEGILARLRLTSRSAMFITSPVQLLSKNSIIITSTKKLQLEMSSPPPNTQGNTVDVFDARKTRETHNLKPDPITGRLIDAHPGKRTIPMRLLVFGVSRTGTMTIYTALEQLGYTPYHMAKAIQAPKSNLDVWRESLNAKFHRIGKPFGLTEFDKIRGEYDAVADVPCIAFVEELIQAYPDAKVLLSHRDVDKWLESMGSSAEVVLRWKSWKWLASWDPALVEPFWKFANVMTPAVYRTLHDFSPLSPARDAFLDHYELVRRICPKERLLEYRVQEGWGPLYAFLGENVPMEGFPRMNEQGQFIFAHNVMWWLGLGKMVWKISMMAVPIIVFGVAVWQRKMPGRLTALWHQI